MKIKNTIRKLLSFSRKEDEEVTTLTPDRRQPVKPFYTFYRIGPEAITWFYHVDNSCLKEILDDDGIIGHSFYDNYPDVIENLENYKNDWIRCDAPREALAQLRKDLLLLAEKHNYPSAYTILGSISDTFNEALSFFLKASENGIKEGMSTVGVYYLMDRKVEQARMWIEKSAELGDEIGLLMTAISYEYGTFTPVDYKRAVNLYRRLIKEHENIYALINLGVMYININYFHTAHKMFRRANQIAKDDPNKLAELTNFAGTEALSNLESTTFLLSLPAHERRKHAVVQFRSPEIDMVFVNDKKRLEIVGGESNEIWLPDDASEIDPADIEEHKSLHVGLMPTLPIVKYPYDDFVFPTIPVEIRNEEIFGNQHELVFLEKNVHYELNQYIQHRLPQLRVAFKRIGYHLTYLPSHTRDINDFDDLLGTYFDTYGSIDINDYFRSSKTFHSKTRDESSYWDYLFSKEALPDDCAGFLRHTPRIEDIDRRPLYDYILFPFKPGTNWDKAFLCLIDYLATLPFVELKQKKRLPSATTLLIDESFNIFIIDVDGSPINEIKMPVLSKALYFLFLRHRDGFAIKYLCDFKKELTQFYSKMSNRKDISRSIDDLTDPTKNSANEKISRIRHAFEDALRDYDNALNFFAPIGKRGESYAVMLDRNRVVWQPKDIDLFI